MPRWLGYVVFFLIATLVLAVGHAYVWHRLLRVTVPPAPYARTGVLTLILLFVSLPLGMLLSSALPRSLGGPVAIVVFSWMGTFMFLMFALVATEPTRWLASLLEFMRERPSSPDRRLFLERSLSVLAGLTALGASGLAFAQNQGEISKPTVRIPVRRLPASLEGLRIVQLTDVHIGPILGKDWLASVVGETNALNPDVVVITGDLVDGSVAALRSHTEVLQQLRARFGVYFVTGNHEYYSGVDAWMAELERLGIRVLRNECVTLGNEQGQLALAGVHDFGATRLDTPHKPDIAAALANRDPAIPVLLLAHQPKQIHQAAAMGVDVMLSGHTHGGQLWPWKYMVHLDQPYVDGLHHHKGKTWLYVSRGTGFWGPPMRLAAPAEITLVVLTRAADA